MAVDFRREQVADRNTDTARKSDVEALERIIVQVRRDSRTDSAQYLDETDVPHGGE